MSKIKNSGREADPIHVYNEQGKYMRTFISSAEFAKYYNLSRNTLPAKKYYNINNKKETSFIYKVHNYAFAAYERVGRKCILDFIKKENSKFIRKYEKRKNFKETPIDCYNLNGEIIATFKSDYYLEALLGRQVKVHSKLTPHFNGDIKFVIREENQSL